MLRQKPDGKKQCALSHLAPLGKGREKKRSHAVMIGDGYCAMEKARRSRRGKSGSEVDGIPDGNAGALFRLPHEVVCPLWTVWKPIYA